MKVPLRAWQPIICYYYARGPAKTTTVWEQKVNLAKTLPRTQHPNKIAIPLEFFKVLWKNRAKREKQKKGIADNKWVLCDIEFCSYFFRDFPGQIESETHQHSNTQIVT